MFGSAGSAILYAWFLSQAIRDENLSDQSISEHENFAVYVSKNTTEMEMFFKGTWSVTKGNQNIRFVVRFSAESVYRVKEEELFIKPFLRDLPDGSLLFEVTVNHDREFLDWLTSYGAEAEILEPLRYRKRMQEMLRTWGTFYFDKKAGNQE